MSREWQNRELESEGGVDNGKQVPGSGEEDLGLEFDIGF